MRVASYKQFLVILVLLHNLDNCKKARRVVLILLNFVCDEMVDESSQRSVLWLFSKIHCSHWGEKHVYPKSELIILADSLGKCSLTVEFFLVGFCWFFWMENTKNITSFKGMWWQIVQSQIRLSCSFRSAALPLPAPMRIFIAFVVISFTPGAQNTSPLFRMTCLFPRKRRFQSREMKVEFLTKRYLLPSSLLFSVANN